jgi:hypothetical protein
MAGEGIEYAWAGSKQAFRSTPLTLRRNKKGFHALVRKCLDEKTVNLMYMRKCAARMRRYMLAYHSLAKNGTTTTTAGNPDEKVGFHLIQSLKKHKSHRNVPDPDSLFVKKLLNDMKTCGKEE